MPLASALVAYVITLTVEPDRRILTEQVTGEPFCHARQHNGLIEIVVLLEQVHE